MNVIKRFFSSRKFWAFLVGLVTLISSAFEDGVIIAQEVQAMSALIIGYIFSVAWEDGKHAEAAGNIGAANAKAEQPASPVSIDAATVEVTATETPQSRVTSQGLM